MEFYHVMQCRKKYGYWNDSVLFFYFIVFAYHTVISHDDHNIFFQKEAKKKKKKVSAIKFCEQKRESSGMPRL